MNKLILLLFVSTLVLRADDLTTRDGTVYKDYKVLGHDAGFITILYADGGGQIPLANLPEAMQKQYGYDPAAAKIAAAKAEADWKANQAKLAQERIAAQAREKQIAQQTATTQPTPNPAAPAVDIAANEAQIAKDWSELGDVKEDLKIARKDAGLDRGSEGWQAEGHVKELEKRENELSTEIGTLKRQEWKVAAQ